MGLEGELNPTNERPLPVRLGARNEPRLVAPEKSVNWKVSGGAVIELVAALKSVANPVVPTGRSMRRLSCRKLALLVVRTLLPGCPSLVPSMISTVIGVPATDPTPEKVTPPNEID